MRAFSTPELIVILVLMTFMAPGILYLAALQKALERCSPVSRAMRPRQVWLLLIPVFNLVWHFMVVIRIAKSLRSEFDRRNILIGDPAPAKTIGLVMCGLGRRHNSSGRRDLRDWRCRLLDCLLG